MPITESDIVLLGAQRPTDEPDGGGRITGNVIQSGQVSNLFDAVSDLARVTGNVSLRKFAAAVQTDGTEKYLGARVIISEVPADTKIHAVLLEPVFDDDTRSDAVVKMGSYLAPGGMYSGHLYGDHLKNMRSVILLQRTNVPLPAVGDRLYLVKDEGLVSEMVQFVAITAVDDIVRTFADDQGEFERRQVTLSISAGLEADFPGFEAIRRDASLNYTGKTRVRETIIADAAQYKTTKRLAVAAQMGETTVNVGSVFAQVLPSSQVETPLANVDPTPPADLYIGSGQTVTYTYNQPWTPASNLQLPGPAMAGSIRITVPSGEITDHGDALRLAGADIGTVDLSAGTLYLTSGNFAAGFTVSYEPAGAAQRAPQSTGIQITISNRALNYVAFLDPPPARGSVSVAFRSGGRWYVLADNRAGGLVGSSSGFGAGQINYDDGVLAVTLGALPDVGSYLIIGWGVASQETHWPAATLKASCLIDIPGEDALQPGTVSITWPNPGGGAALSSSDAAVDGTLAGAATGRVRYSGRQIEFAPNILPAVGAQLTINYHDGPKQVDTFSHPARNGGGQVPVTASLGAIEPGSLEVEWDTLTDEAVLGTYNAAQMREMGLLNTWVDPTHVARDNGAGQIVLNGAVIGTVNYGSGAVVFNPDVTVKIPRPNYGMGGVVSTTQMRDTGGTSLGEPLPTRWRINFTGITYVNAPSLYPNDESGRVVLRYNSSAAGTAQTITVPFAPTLEAVPDVAAVLLPGALTLQVGTEIIGDSGTGVLRTRSGGDWLGRGTVAYVNGALALTSWPVNVANAWQRLSCVSVAGEMLTSDMVFRTVSAPLYPGSLSLRFARSTGGTVTVTADIDGNIIGEGIFGTIDWETGVGQVLFGEMVDAAGNESEPWYQAGAVVAGKVYKPRPVVASTIRYSAVAYRYLPISSSFLGMDPVQLPQDGRVRGYREGDVVLVFHTAETAPQVVGNGDTIDTGRDLLSWAHVIDANGERIHNGYVVNLDEGQVHFSNVSGYAQPVTVRSRIETEALCVDAQIDGTLTLQRQLAHDYPAGQTLVASVYGGKTLQAGVTAAFSQATWTNVWSDSRIGASITARYDDTTYPILVNNTGTINQRWAFIVKTGGGTFDLVGETRGVVATDVSMAADFTLTNPANGEPILFVDRRGWGGGWSAGNVMRTNTRGALLVGWSGRTVEQSPPGAPGVDRITLEVRGGLNPEEA